MREYVIYTDSGCDISPELLAEWGVRCQNLIFRFEGDEREYKSGEISAEEFYAKMREGAVTKTAAVSPEVFGDLFEETLACGKDVLYIGLSSGLSTTFNSARIAALALEEKYPDRRVCVVDSRAASSGLGLILRLAVEKQQSGASLEQTAEYIEQIKFKISIWFTVDDLVYLKRGGRISPTAAFFGNMLGIKPLLRMDDEGHLIPVSKIRGRKMAIAALADKYGELSVGEGGKIFISHGDCRADADYLASLLSSRYGAEVELVENIGSAIGAHSGPGTLALFFVGKSR